MIKCEWLIRELKKTKIFMQKLKQRTKKNTPTDAPQVRSNCGLLLNREETLSVTSLKTCLNNPDVDLHQQHTGELKAMVYVQNLEGKPLMSCTPCKARKLLKNNKAIVVKLYPFTIKLNFECENQIQPVKLGIDSGYKNIGFSAKTDKKELISGELILDNKTSERLYERRMYRRGRKNKLWYRKPRFLNRKKKEGWLPPSIHRKYDTHLSLIKLIKSILPVSEVIIEVANFDIQKINNPDINGIEYQQGSMYDYQNLRSYVLSRENGLCQLCSEEFSSGNPSHLHHITPRSQGGTNKPSNLGLLHEKCHKKLHSKGLYSLLKRSKQFKPNTFMSIIHKKFWIDVPDLKVTYGYITFIKRQEYSISKTHNNDAFVIAGGTDQTRCKPLVVKQKHRNNRVIQLNRKGFEPSIRKHRYSLQPKDLIWIENKKYIVVGIQNKGKYIKVENSKKVFPVKLIEKKYCFGSFSYN